MSEAARWKRVKEIFDAAAACRVEDRAARVRELCGEDRALHEEVESLLAADAGRTPILDHALDGDLRGRVFDAVAGALEDATCVLAPGDRLGAYEITGFLGRGGMGEVYRARDTKLNRDVALKIVPDAFANESDPSAGSGSSRARSRTIGSAVSVAKRRSWRRSIIRTSATSTASRTV